MRRGARRGPPLLRLRGPSRRARSAARCSTRRCGRSGHRPAAREGAALRGGAGRLAGAVSRRAAAEHGALFILNDRPDLVAACGADGVHVGQDDMPVRRGASRRRAERAGRASRRIRREQVEAPSAAEGDDRPDQLSVGPVWETPTKAGRPATGLGLIDTRPASATHPLVRDRRNRRRRTSRRGGRGRRPADRGRASDPRRRRSGGRRARAAGIARPRGGSRADGQPRAKAGRAPEAQGARSERDRRGDDRRPLRGAEHAAPGRPRAAGAGGAPAPWSRSARDRLRADRRLRSCSPTRGARP